MVSWAGAHTVSSTRTSNQNLIQVFGEFRDLFFAELQVAEVGYVADFLFGDFHANAFVRDVR